jgi:hypothetical protein
MSASSEQESTSTSCVGKQPGLFIAAPAGVQRVSISPCWRKLCQRSAPMMT